MGERDNDLIDPDPFILAGVCLQGAAVVLQLVQISKANSRPSSSLGAVQNRSTRLEHLETALSGFDAAIARAERTVRRSSQAPDKELYEASFRISLGVMNLSAKNVVEYHNAVSDAAAKLSALTLWIGHIIGQDPDIGAALGQDIVEVVSNAGERLNKLMAEGGPIEAVLTEAKLVLGACRGALRRHLDTSEN